MGDSGIDSPLASEFVKFLNAQLKECREEVQRLAQHNAALQAELEGLRNLASVPGDVPGDREVVVTLQSQIGSLRKELEHAQSLSETRRAECDAWKTRYEDLKPQLTGSAAINTQLLDSLRELLEEFKARSSMVTEAASPNTAAAPHATVKGFLGFLERLPGTARIDPIQTTAHVVFRGTKFPLMSKAATKACIGGFNFFGPFLNWCSPTSQHAYVVCAEYRFTPRTSPQGDPTWARGDRWMDISGQQREIFHIDGDNICYAGTFFCHAGPRSVKLSELGPETSDNMLQSLARGSFNALNNNHKAKAKIHTPILAELLREGTATVQLLGLQRVGFNNALLQILLRAHNKREQAAGTSRAVAEALGWAQKRDANEMAGGVDGDDAGGEDAGEGPSRSKVPRLELDETLLTGTGLAWSE